MERVKRPVRRESETLVEVVRRHYFILGDDGCEDAERLRRAVAALEVAELEQHEWLPPVTGVPHVRFRVDTPDQIAEAVRRFLPEVERDPRLHALSFVDPLAVAQELGIVVSPLVARVVRRGLGRSIAFDRRKLDEHGRLRGVGEMRWRPKQGGPR